MALPIPLVDPTAPPFGGAAGRAHVPAVDAAEPGCTGCSRRALLRGLGVAALGSLVLPACGSDSTVPVVDAPESSCPSGELCLDTSKAPYTALANVNGAVIVSSPRDEIIVVRTSTTAVAALSAICTHAGCSVDFQSSNKLLFCPCHGSEFSLSGTVVRGPAFQPLHVYTASLSGTVITITGV